MINTLAGGTGLYLKHTAECPQPFSLCTSPRPPVWGQGLSLRIVSRITLCLYPLVFPVAMLCFRITFRSDTSNESFPEFDCVALSLRTSPTFTSNFGKSFTKSQPAFPCPPFRRLTRQHHQGTRCAAMHLVRRAVTQSLIVTGADEDGRLHHSPRVPIVHNFVSVRLHAIVVTENRG